jgi:hypothetical protein
VSNANIKPMGVVMRSTRYVEWTNDELTENNNNRFDQLIAVLLADGVISQEQSEEIEKYRSVVIEQNIFGRLLKHLSGRDKDDWVFTIQKIDPK